MQTTNASSSTKSGAVYGWVHEAIPADTIVHSCQHSQKM
jgi:hypothetical protein